MGKGRNKKRAKAKRRRKRDIKTAEAAKPAMADLIIGHESRGESDAKLDAEIAKRPPQSN